MRLRIANAPASWGVEPPSVAQDPPWEQLLDEVSRAGYAGCELGPLGYMTTDPAALADAFARRSLALPAGFVMEPLGPGAHRDRLAAVTRDTCRLLAGAGARTLIVMDAVATDRNLTAGRIDAAPRLQRSAWGALVDGIRRMAAIAGEEFGLRTAIHPHVGTHVEFEDEVEALLGATTSSELGLCPDTAHTVYAGMDPVTLLRRHGERIAYVHFKDVDAEGLDRVRACGEGFRDAVATGVFKPLGHGCVDFAAVARTLSDLGYQGWATVEQDRLPSNSLAACEEAASSLRFLRRAGVT